MSFLHNWKALKLHLDKYYFRVDYNALRIVLATQTAHNWLNDPAVWINIIGVPGCGKTEIYVGAVDRQKIPRTQVISNLSTNSFLSGFGDKNGILPQFGKEKNGLLLFPDLTTTFSSIDQKERIAIMGQMRSIFDGLYHKQVGNKDKQLMWKGKVTAIAACTPDIESYWITARDMGERWLTLRLRTIRSDSDMHDIAKMAGKHIGKKAEILKEYSKLVNILMNEGRGNFGVLPNAEQSDQLTSLAVLSETLRVSIKREWSGRGMVVVGTGNIQMPTRINQAMTSIIRGATAMRGTLEVDEADMQLARRVAVDSIPPTRWAILKHLINVYPEPLQKRELALAAKLTKETFDRELENLRYLEIVNLTRLTDPDLDEENENLTDSNNRDLKDLDVNHQYHIGKVRVNDLVNLTSRVVNLLQATNMFKTVNSQNLGKIM